MIHISITGGTPAYMAPEVIRGEKYDKAVDTFSYGVIIYECLYGNLPFVNDQVAIKG